MASRRNIPSTYEEHSMRAPEVIQRGPLPDALVDELARQEAEMERLISDSRRLASAHLSMRQNLAAAQQEGHRIRGDIKKIEIEGDVEIKILLDKIMKLEADVRDGDSKKKELQELLNEARSLVSERMVSSEKIQQATRELEDTRSDIKRLPEMQAELESLRQEHQMLRKTFELKKGANTEKVARMKNLEKDLIHLTEQVERLRADLSSAEQRANGAVPLPPPYNGPYMDQENAMHYVDPYGRPSAQMVIAAEGVNQDTYSGYVAGPPVTGGMVNPDWGRRM